MENNEIKVALFDTKPYDQEMFDHINEKYGFTIKYFPGRLTMDTVVLSKGFHAVCIFVNDYVTQKIARALAENGVSLIALRSAGYNNVAFDHLPENIRVVRVPAYSPHAVAEHTVALILTLNRKTHKAYFRTRDNNFSISGLMGVDLYKKTAGIIGTGKIGRIVAEILRGFGMQVLTHDPFPMSEWAQEKGIKYTSLDELYRESDIVSLHCPLTPENIHMINDQAIRKMKDGVMIINTGRGKLINTADLVKGLKNGHIGSAGLDVYEEETEYFFEDYSSTGLKDDVLARLLTFPNVLVTSHQAFFTREAMENIAETTLHNISMYYHEQKLPNEVCVKCS